MCQGTLGILGRVARSWPLQATVCDPHLTCVLLCHAQQDFVIPSAAARKTRFTECGAVAHESVGVPDYYCVYVRSMVGGRHRQLEVDNCCTEMTAAHCSK
jgi:hypothetical protein